MQVFEYFATLCLIMLAKWLNATTIVIVKYVHGWATQTLFMLCHLCCPDEHQSGNTPQKNNIDVINEMAANNVLCFI